MPRPRRLNPTPSQVVLGISITPKMKAAVDQAADVKGISTSQLVRALIARDLAAGGNPCGEPLSIPTFEKATVARPVVRVTVDRHIKESLKVWAELRFMRVDVLVQDIVTQVVANREARLVGTTRAD